MWAIQAKMKNIWNVIKKALKFDNWTGRVHQRESTLLPPVCQDLLMYAEDISSIYRTQSASNEIAKKSSQSATVCRGPHPSLPHATPWVFILDSFKRAGRTDGERHSSARHKYSPLPQKCCVWVKQADEDNNCYGSCWKNGSVQSTCPPSMKPNEPITPSDSSTKRLLDGKSCT